MTILLWWINVLQREWALPLCNAMVTNLHSAQWSIYKKFNVIMLSQESSLSSPQYGFSNARNYPLMVKIFLSNKYHGNNIIYRELIIILTIWQLNGNLINKCSIIGTLPVVFWLWKAFSRYICKLFQNRGIFLKFVAFPNYQ